MHCITRGAVTAVYCDLATGRLPHGQGAKLVAEVSRAMNTLFPGAEVTVSAAPHRKIGYLSLVSTLCPFCDRMAVHGAMNVICMLEHFAECELLP